MRKILMFLMFLFISSLLIACQGGNTSYPISIEITADTGIEISLYQDKGWKPTLTSQDIESRLNELYDNGFNFDIVSTTDGRNFYKANLEGNDPTTSGFVSFRIYFRSYTSDVISINSISLSSPIVQKTADVSFTTSKGVVVQAGETFGVSLADSVRVSLGGVYLDEEKIIVYENAESSTNTVSGGMINADLTSSKGSVDYYYQIAQTYPFGSDQVTLPETMTSLDTKTYFSLGSIDINQYLGYVVLRVWVEGWDLECYDEIDDSLLNLSVLFST